MSTFRALRLLPVVALCALATLSGASTAAAGSRYTVSDTRPGWATPSNEAGNRSDNATMVFSVWLGWRNPGDLATTLAGLYDPSNPAYHHWLSPEQFHAAYSPSTQDVGTVTTWLRSQGFSIVEIPDNRLFVTAEGSVAQAEQAFQVDEQLYHVDGTLVPAPNHDPTVPVALSGVVRAITGLDGALALAQPDHRRAPPPPPAGKSVGPCSRSWGEQSTDALPDPYQAGPLPWIICGYQPSQIDSAYGIDQLHRQGLEGQGQTIAITGAFFSPTLTRDADHFSREFGLPRLHHSNYRQIVAPGTLRYPRDDSETQSWYVEQALDVEWAHAVAPRARIVYVGAANDAGGLDQAITYAVDHRVANVISNSWGEPEDWASTGEIHSLEAVFEQAAAEGIGVYFASGDDGDSSDEVGHASAGFPDSSPWVTSVGGTSLAIGRDGSYEWETGWGTTQSTWNGHAWSPAAPGEFLYGSGGGVSHVFAQPSWQAGVVPARLARWQGTAHRTEPDLAIDADPQTGVVFSQTYVEPNGRRRIIDSWIGGTSLGAPLVTGLMALADQRSGRPHGFIDPSIYRLAGTPAFHDVTPSGGVLAVLRNQLQPNGTIKTLLRSLDRDGKLRTRRGWDPVTGIGSPDAPELLARLG